METKELLYGLIGFFLGGLIVAIAANTFNNAELQKKSSSTSEIRMESDHKSPTDD